MNYARYFHPGQKVALKITVDESGVEQRFESLHAIVSSCSGSTLKISFPPPFNRHADYPFTVDQKIELHADHQGMGICVHSEFIENSEDQKVRIKLSGDLQYFNRRRHRRFELKLWVGLEGGTESIYSMRRKWLQMVRHLQDDHSSSPLTEFTRRDVSLSSNGIGLYETKAAAVGNYFLIFLALDDDLPTICAMGEVVRCLAIEKETFNIGIHFDCIEEEDRNRIVQYIKQHGRPKD